MKQAPFLTALILLLVLSSGCINLDPAEDPTRFYVLSPEDPVAAAVDKPTPQHTLILGPVTVARYLDNPRLAVREDEHRLRYLDHRQWAEPLSHSLHRLLKSRMTAAVEEIHIATFGTVTPSVGDRQLSVEWTQFELVGDDRIQAAARWTLTWADTRERIRSGYIQKEETVSWIGFEDLTGPVAALQRAAEAVADDLAQVLGSD